MTLKCTDEVPKAVSLTFVDNCDDDFEVTAIEEDGGGNVCDGKRTVRKWEGPTDECGNIAKEVQQVITMVDEEAPVLPDTLEALAYTCPKDFRESYLTAPVATDDCDDDVAVTSVLTRGQYSCQNITVVSPVISGGTSNKAKGKPQPSSSFPGMDGH